MKMNKPEVVETDQIAKDTRSNEKGSAIVIALLVLALISVFVAFAMSRTAAEAAAVGNETSEARTMYAAQGGLETMTRNFNKIFEQALNPSQAELDRVIDPNIIPALSRAQGGSFDFVQELDQISDSSATVLSGGPYTGLYAIRDTWRLRSTATGDDGTQIRLTRNILNNRIPIFQFGVFYEDDLELFNGPTFGFGGRVHSNRHFFIHPSANGAYFDSRVTAAGHIVTQVKRNGDPVNATTAKTWVKDASGVYKQLLPDRGSVLNGSPNVFASAPFVDPQLPPSALNPSWASQSAIFDGNLQARVNQLKLPLKVGSNNDLIEMIRRGKEAPGAIGGDLYDNAGVLAPVAAGAGAGADNLILRAERFANKTGIRVSLADSKEKLPGCATGVGTAAVTAACGVRLDGDVVGLGANPNTADAVLNNRSRGYQPLPMSDGYQATRVNGERLNTGGTREVWIKIETVATNTATNALVTSDITRDILSLGMTEQAPASMGLTPYNNAVSSTSAITNAAPQAAPTGTDSRSIIKIQRFAIPGPSIPNYTAAGVHTFNAANSYNYVRRYTAAAGDYSTGCTAVCVADDIDLGSGFEKYGHLKLANTDEAVVPFPIKMFDTREGLYYDQKSTTYYSNANFDNFKKVPREGVMSMVDIDIANLRRFLRGDFNGLFSIATPFYTAAGHTLRNTDIPDKAGWVLYVSDRRGDADFDGEIDMEDIYGAAPGNDGIMQPGEDLDMPGLYGNGVLETGGYGTETERYAVNAVYVDEAAVIDQKYYRRGVRLINGSTLPGIYDSATAANTKGLTVASENGIYVQGNYNATGIGTVPASTNSTFDQYLPFNTPTHIPASVVADAVTILSNAWNDSESFRYPWDVGSRDATTTQTRFAMLAGDTITSAAATPNQGGGDARLNGGLHNFKRFLEDWGGRRLDYAGSLINLYNSRNNNGAFKCCGTVYSPPRRNWVFDSTFLDPGRMPPGTPYFQYVQTTGFERTTD